MFTPTKKQQEFMESQADITILGGGCGGGMSYGVAMSALKDLQEGKEVLVILPSWNHLNLPGGFYDHIENILRKTGLSDTLEIRKSIRTIKNKNNNGQLFIYAPDKSKEFRGNLLNYYTTLFDTIYIDNASIIPDKDLEIILSSSNKSKVKLCSIAYDIIDCMSGDRNLYLYNFIVTNGLHSGGSENFTNIVNGKSVNYIKIISRDNPFLDQTYSDWLNSSANLHLIEGLWEV